MSDFMNYKTLLNLQVALLVCAPSTALLHKIRRNVMKKFFPSIILKNSSEKEKNSENSFHYKKPQHVYKHSWSHSGEYIVPNIH